MSTQTTEHSATRTPLLDKIVLQGNRGHRHSSNRIICSDGYTLSVIAGGGTYCSPRPDYCLCGLTGSSEDTIALGDGVPHDFAGPYTAVEVMIIDDDRPWGDDDGGVYGYVPVEKVRALIEAHGGER